MVATAGALVYGTKMFNWPTAMVVALPLGVLVHLVTGVHTPLTDEVSTLTATPRVWFVLGLSVWSLSLIAQGKLKTFGQ